MTTQFCEKKRNKKMFFHLFILIIQYKLIIEPFTKQKKFKIYINTFNLRI